MYTEPVGPNMNARAEPLLSALPKPCNERVTNVAACTYLKLQTNAMDKLSAAVTARDNLQSILPSRIQKRLAIYELSRRWVRRQIFLSSALVDNPLRFE